MLTESARHCLFRLGDFSGRTSREEYLPFANFVTGLLGGGIACLGLLPIPSFREPPPGADPRVEQVLQQTDMDLMIALALSVAAVAAVLLAAATVRRLHDRGRSASWYVATMAIAGMGMATLLFGMSVAEKNGGVVPFQLAALAKVLWLLAFMSGARTMYLLRGPGDPDRNRYGASPDGRSPGAAAEADRLDAAFNARLAARAAASARPNPTSRQPFGRRRR